MSASSVALHEAVRAALKAAATLPGGERRVTLYDGEVGQSPPTESGTRKRVLPYWVLWASPGRPSPERAVSERSSRTNAWETSVTTAAGHPDWALGAVDLLRDTLRDLVLPGGGQLVEDEDGPRLLLRDPDVDPARFYLPTRFTALLP